MRQGNKKRDLFGLGLCLAAFSCSIGVPFGIQPNQAAARRARQSSPQLVTWVPLQTRDSGVSLEVMVNGQGPFLFGLDTGLSQPAMVSQTLVERLQLPIVEGFRLSDGSGKNSRNVDGVRIDAVRLGNVSFNQVLALVWGDDPEGEGKPGTYGTIGFELFKDYVVTFDYPGKRLLIATGELPKADGMAVLSYTLDRGTPRVPITLAGLSLEAWIDTGGVGKILLPPSLAEKLPLRTPLRHAGKVATILNEVDLYRSELEGDLRIGNASLHNPILLFAEVLQSPNIGRDALHEFVITFDQRNKRVRFEQSLQENERE